MHLKSLYLTDSTQALFVIMPMRLNDAPAPRKEAAPAGAAESP